jgi:hypothetical protein
LSIFVRFPSLESFLGSVDHHFSSAIGFEVGKVLGVECENFFFNRIATKIAKATASIIIDRLNVHCLIWRGFEKERVAVLLEDLEERLIVSARAVVQLKETFHMLGAISSPQIAQIRQKDILYDRVK